MDIELGRFPTTCERPEPLKFAAPIFLLPELFTTPRHLAIVLGYLASIGWEVYVPDLRAAFGKGATPPLAQLHFSDLVALAGEAIDALGRDAVVLGHGVGGLVAMKLAAHPRDKASARQDSLRTDRGLRSVHPRRLNKNDAPRFRPRSRRRNKRHNKFRRIREERPAPDSGRRARHLRPIRKDYGVRKINRREASENKRPRPLIAVSPSF